MLANPQRAGALGIAAVLAYMCTIVALAVPASATVLVDTTPEPSWRVDGVVNATVIVGDVVVVGGTFANALSPSGATLPRANLAGFSLSTGEPLAGWRADADATVRALVTDGASVWVGGNFRNLAGVGKNRIAKVDALSGAIDPLFTASATNAVRALALRGPSLFLGGNFGAINGATRLRIGKVSADRGRLDTSFVAVLDGTVHGLTASPTSDEVYASGAFTQVNGLPRSGVAALDGSTGATDATVFGSATTTVGLDISPDGALLYGAVAASGNAATAWNTVSGARVWRARADGDVQVVRYFNGTVYFGFHDGFAADPTVKVLAADALTGALDPNFRPVIGNFWGVFAIAASAEAVVIGGDFSAVSGQARQGFAIFAADLPVPIVFLDSSTNWRFADQGVRSPDWESVGFDDSSWPSGRPQLGYGDGDETTLLNAGPDTARHLAAYFRSSFEVTEVPGTLDLLLAADDGAVVYLNGVEIVRDNMPAGAITNTTRSVVSRSGAEENLLRTFTLDPGLLTLGTNVIAVEVHQSSNAGAVDLTFNARLAGFPA